MITARVLWESRIPEYLTETEAKLVGLMHEAQETGARAAQTAETRIMTGRLKASIHAGEVKFSAKAIEGEIVADEWYATFQNWGTMSNRKVGLSPGTLRRRATPSGQASSGGLGAGITPLYFLEAGQRIGLEILEAGSRKIL